MLCNHQIRILLVFTRYCRAAAGSMLSVFLLELIQTPFLFLLPLQRLKFEIAEVMTEIEQLTCVGER